MWQRAHIFHQLEAAETMRAYVVHNVDGIENLLANLEMAKSEVVVVQELAEEDVALLRKRRLWRPRKRRLKKKLSN